MKFRVQKKHYLAAVLKNRCKCKMKTFINANKLRGVHFKLLLGLGRLNIYNNQHYKRAVRSTPRFASLHCGVLLPIPAPLGISTLFGNNLKGMFFREGCKKLRSLSPLLRKAG